MPPKKQRRELKKAKREAIMKNEKTKVTVHKRRQLVDLNIESVHLVDKAANRRRFLITKNDKSGIKSENLGRFASLDPKPGDPVPVTKAAEKTLGQQLDEIRDKLNGVEDADVPKEIAESIQSIAEAVSVPAKEKDPEPETEPNTDSDGDDKEEKPAEPDPDHTGDAAIVKPTEPETKAEGSISKEPEPAPNTEEEDKVEDEDEDDEPSTEDEELSEDDQADADAIYAQAFNEHRAELVS